jgi:predicted deacetylase
MTVRRKRLLLSIHDVGPKFEAEVEKLAALYDELVGPNRFAMLVVPDHWNLAPLAAAPAFQAKLRRWSDAGIEMFLHGWSHQDTSSHDGAVAGFKAKHMTAGEGEFLGLDVKTATTRMIEGRKLLEDVIGRDVSGFIAPAWLYGAGALEALATLGFKLAEDHMRVWQPATATTVARGPVITWASRSRARTASSLFFAAAGRNALAPMPNMRIAVHPGDTTKPEIIRSIANTVRHAMRGRELARYADLI